MLILFIFYFLKSKILQKKGLLFKVIPKRNHLYYLHNVLVIAYLTSVLLEASSLLPLVPEQHSDLADTFLSVEQLDAEEHDFLSVEQLAAFAEVFLSVEQDE
jgi:hypothetical protein